MAYGKDVKAGLEIEGASLVDLAPTILHLMGEPQEIRPLWVKNGEAVLSPPWSIHCGCGTASYRFVWGMGGENQRFDDMDGAPIPTLR